MPIAKGRCSPVNSLFSDPLPISWLPGETLFSLCSRQHRLAGHRRPAATCQQLFGHPTMGAAHDFPSRLDAFVARTHGQLGNSDEIISWRTILPFYLSFSSREVGDRARTLMRGTSIGSLKFRLGILTSRFRAHHPLKACPRCMADDVHEHGVPLWHLEHQLPGSWACMRHNVAVSATSLKTSGALRFHWLLPDNASDLRLHVEGDRNLANLLVIAQASRDLWRLGQRDLGLEPDRVVATYRQALRARGFVSGRGYGHLHHRHVGVEYAQYVAPLRTIPEFAALPRTPDQAAAEVARLIGARRTGIHPLRHVVFIAWCFGCVDALLRAYEDTSAHIAERLTAIPTGQTVDHRASQRAAVLDLLSMGYSATAAARSIGVDPSTAMAWAAALGLRSSRRPSRMTEPNRSAMVCALRGGAEKSEAAAMGGVSVESVTRLLRTEVGLRADWTQARHEVRQRSARHRWMTALKENPRLGTKGARLLEPAAYAWLYRNDRDWLDQQVPPRCPQRQPSSSRVDWERRDLELAHAVREAALQIATSRPDARINLAALCSLIPDLRAKAAKLERLPRTEKVLDEVLTRRRR